MACIITTALHVVPTKYTVNFEGTAKFVKMWTV